MFSVVYLGLQACGTFNHVKTMQAFRILYEVVLIMKIAGGQGKYL